MNIQMNSLASHALFFMRESAVPSLTEKLKKILVIASIAFALLAACYLMLRSSKIEVKNEDDDKTLPDNWVKKTKHQPQTAQDFIEAGKKLRLDEKIQFPDGTEMSQEEIFLKAIELDPDCSSAYNYLGTICDALSKIKLPDGAEMTQQQLFLKAIEKDPNNSSAICNLGSTLEGGGSMVLPNGAQLTREQQFVRVIRKHQAVAHPSLTKISLPNDAAEMTRRELFLRAIECDPANPAPYFNLCFTLQRNESVKLPDGKKMDARALCIHTLRLNPNYAEAWSDLANTIPVIFSGNRPYQFPKMKPLTRLELYLDAVELDPNDGSVYSNIALFLNEDETIELPNGDQMDCIELLLKAIELDPFYYSYYAHLAQILYDDEEVELHDGTILTRSELLDKVDDCANKYGLEMSPY